MSSRDDDDRESRVVTWAVLAGAILLAIGLSLGMGMYTLKKARLKAQGGAPAVVQMAPGASGAVAAGASAGALADDAASVVVENGVVKFYFASGKADVAAGGAQALADIVHGVAAGKKAVISGFHDKTGSAALNAELAKQRALAVRDALLALGVKENQIELRKPEETLAGGSNAEARRVEVSLQ